MSAIEKKGEDVIYKRHKISYISWEQGYAIFSNTRDNRWVKTYATLEGAKEYIDYIDDRNMDRFSLREKTIELLTKDLLYRLAWHSYFPSAPKEIGEQLGLSDDERAMTEITDAVQSFKHDLEYFISNED